MQEFLRQTQDLDSRKQLLDVFLMAPLARFAEQEFCFKNCPTPPPPLINNRELKVGVYLN